MPSSTSNPKPLLPWKTRIYLSLFSAVTDALRRPDGTLNRRLSNFLDRKTSSNPKPIRGIKTSDVTVDPTRNLWFRLFTPTGTTSSSLPVIVFFHGGGFSYLSPASLTYDAICRRFARKLSAIVISVDYRLIPEYRYPAQYDDGFDVLQFIDQNADSLPDTADLSKCFLAGDSAGANVTHNMAVRVGRPRLQNVRIRGQISIQPFFGGEERTESEIRIVNAPIISVERTDWAWKALLPEGSNRDHEAVNVSGPNAVDISGMDYPATIVFVGGFDPLQDWQRRYYAWLKKSGKEAELIEYPSSFLFSTKVSINNSSILLIWILSCFRPKLQPNQHLLVHGQKNNVCSIVSTSSSYIGRVGSFEHFLLKSRSLVATALLRVLHQNVASWGDCQFPHMVLKLFWHNI